MQSPMATPAGRGGDAHQAETEASQAEKDEQICRICLQGSKPEDPFLEPCSCSGSQRYVHEGCLQEWQCAVLSEPNKLRAFRCGTCGSPYRCGLIGKLKLSAAMRSWSAFPWLLREVTSGWGGVVLVALLMVAQGLLLFASAPYVHGLRAGMLLVATDAIRSGTFHQSVVLMVEHSRCGAIGYIVNKPLGHLERSPMAAEEAAWDEGTGGPVMSASHAVTLCRRRPEDDRAQEVVEGVWHMPEAVEPSENRTALEAAADADKRHGGRPVPPGCLRLHGYAGWGRGQLEGEIFRGSWHLARGTQDLGSLWRRLTEMLQPSVPDSEL
mmetsp:Transcript_140013/g.435463  ORF Transcript_140013/g.435463 Transcript_140013/m.435463 type:complete len:325 (+) Transcript_140013:60-1034(+)